MKNLKKALVLLLCAILLIVGSVMGTLAYLTSQDTVKNTFTVGDIVINLDEANVATVDDDDDRTEVGNAYHMLPNQTYTKDPTVWVKEGSEESYIRMIVTVEKYDMLKKAFDSSAAYDDGYIVKAADVLGAASTGDMVVLDNIVDRNAGAWQCVKFTEVGTVGTYEFRYFPGTYTATADDKDGVEDFDMLPALFTKITVPAEIDNEHLGYLNGVEITVAAHAIQAAGFENADAAWTAFDQQTATP